MANDNLVNGTNSNAVSVYNAASVDEIRSALAELGAREANVTARGGIVHWARDAEEANRIVTDLVRAKGVDEVIKVKSMATQEMGLNEHLDSEGIRAIETDLAELIVQLGEDKPSHILVPAIHKNRDQIREIFSRKMPGLTRELTDLSLPQIGRLYGGRDHSTVLNSLRRVEASLHEDEDLSRRVRELRLAIHSPSGEGS